MSIRACRATEKFTLLTMEQCDILLLDNDEPMPYTKALMGSNIEKWLGAMASELQSMHDNQVWNLVDPIDGVRPIGCKWVFKKKTDKDGNIHIYKARLVAKGFKKIHLIDYAETFSPVVMLKSVWILLAIAAHFDYEIWQMNVKMVFVNGNLTEDVYMTQPEGFINTKHAGKICKLQKSIYGLKQAS
jgi:hypothetical protein